MSEQSNEIAQLGLKLDDLTKRIEALEHRSDPLPAPKQPNSLPERAWAVRIANRIGAVTVAIGVIFFFKYAVDENLIGAGAGVWLGILFGFLLLLAGEWLIRKGQKVLAQGITGCGFATIYTALYASHAYYKLISEEAGFLVLLLVSAGATLLAFRYANSAIAAIGFCGALLAPVLLTSGHSGLVRTLTYFVVVAVSALAVALRMNSVVLPTFVAGCALLCAGICFGRGHILWLAAFALLLAILHFGAAASQKSAGKLSASLLVAGHVSVLVAGICGITSWVETASVASELESVLLACYGIGLLIVGSIYTSFPQRSLGSVLLGVVICKLYLYDIWDLARVYRVTAFVGLGVLLLLASFLYSRSDKSSSVS